MSDMTTIMVSKDTRDKLLLMRIKEKRKSIDELIRIRFSFDDDFSATVEPVVAQS
ncbi:MAG: hypothetical protein GPJ52_01820 [Candidatus Heimdallarchaeota archaeon]|nr:hypothetical protein [Candidatus Heimdallarchaeota archaeon]